MIIGRKAGMRIFLLLLMTLGVSAACSGLAPTPPPQLRADQETAVPILANVTRPVEITTPSGQVCQVKARAGALNLRKCGGMNCPVLASLAEGEHLTQAGTQIVDGWLEVRTREGWTGWVSVVHVLCK